MRRPLTTAAALVLTALVCAGPAQAAQRTVCASGCGFTDIQAAVTASGADDLITIGAGNYVLPGTVVIPAGKDGLWIQGAQYGKRANTGDGSPRPGGETVVTAGAGNRAFFVSSSHVNIDGLTIANSGVGIALENIASGQRITNTIFTGDGTAIFPDSNGTWPQSIINNAFIDAGPGGPASGSAVASGAARNLVVADNLFRGNFDASVYLQRAVNVRITGNRSAAGGHALNGSIAQLFGARDVVLDHNVADDFGLAAVWMTGSRNVRVEQNSITGGTRGRPAVWVTGSGGVNQHVVVVGNDLGDNNGTAVGVADGGMLGPLEVHFNRLAVRGIGVFNDGADTVDARYNWWGCNAGPGHPGCAVEPAPDGDNATTSPRLVLSASADPGRLLAPGAQGAVSADLLHDSSGGVFHSADLPAVPIGFATTAGSLSAPSAPLDGGRARVLLAADNSPDADVSATLDGQTVGAHVDFGLPPLGPIGPTGDPGTNGANGTGGTNGANGANGADAGKGATGVTGPQGLAGPQGPQGNAGPRGASVACYVRPTRPFLICKLVNVMTSAPKLTAALYRGKRKMAATSVRVPASQRGRQTRLGLKLPLAKRLRPGRYSLVIKQGRHELLRESIRIEG